MTVVCTATAEDGSGNSGTAELTVTVTPPPPQVTISGKITYDYVPFNTNNIGLNYNAISQEPAPGVTVEALNSNGAILQTAHTDGNGDYSLSVNGNTEVRIRVKAEMVQTSGPEWDVKVVDNTSSDSLYAFQGSLANSGSVNSTRNLNAASGWGGSSYTSTRVAAPFAILAPIYESMQRVSAVDSDVIFPSINFNWSVNNRIADNIDLARGEIGTGSAYVSFSNADRRLLILGDDNTDTDEYDKHVIIHEWGHYFEDQLSRSDSIGGLHGPGDRLDPRVAMGEGFGNALSGIMTDDPIYKDSLGSRQEQGFSFDLEANAVENEGWYSEASVQSILYDIYDNTDDGSDTLSAGFAPIYNVLTSDSYRNNILFTTIFSFLEQFRLNNPSDVTVLNALASGQSIIGTDSQGTGETNNGGVAGVFPLHKNIAVNGPSVEICLDVSQGEGNKLGNRSYLAFDVAAPAIYTFRMNRVSGDSNRNPEFSLHRAGEFIGVAVSDELNSEVASANLTDTGQYLIDAYDQNNGRNSNIAANACYDFRITR